MGLPRTPLRPEWAPPVHLPGGHSRSRRCAGRGPTRHLCCLEAARGLGPPDSAREKDEAKPPMGPKAYPAQPGAYRGPIAHADTVRSASGRDKVEPCTVAEGHQRATTRPPSKFWAVAWLPVVSATAYRSAYEPGHRPHSDRFESHESGVTPSPSGPSARSLEHAVAPQSAELPNSRRQPRWVSYSPQDDPAREPRLSPPHCAHVCCAVAMKGPAARLGRGATSADTKNTSQRDRCRRLSRWPAREVVAGAWRTKRARPRRGAARGRSEQYQPPRQEAGTTA